MCQMSMLTSRVASIRLKLEESVRFGGSTISWSALVLMVAEDGAVIFGSVSGVVPDGSCLCSRGH